MADQRYTHDGCFCGDPFCAGCEEEDAEESRCDRCGRISETCEDVPMMGYSLVLCRKCGLAAYASREAV